MQVIICINNIAIYILYIFKGLKKKYIVILFFSLEALFITIIKIDTNFYFLAGRLILLK